MPIKEFQARVGLELMGRMAECYGGRRREVVQARQKERRANNGKDLDLSPQDQARPASRGDQLLNGFTF